MKILLDTQVLLWWFRDDAALSTRARRTIAKGENEILVSAASGWEMAIKNQSGKLQAQDLLNNLEAILVEEGFMVLPISLNHALRAGSLVQHHKDPFDRMLIAQSQAENLPVLSNDPAFDRYGVQRLW